MDDTLEQPKHSPNVGSPDEDREQDSSGDEDGGLDWTKLPLGNNAARPIIPRRGEKDFEPSVWYPHLARAHVTLARGVHFTSMGHSKRLELLPEEALYLVEKGSLFCWKASHDVAGEDVEWDSASQGSPMSVQQAYAEMVGKQDLTLDRYHTFSYLRRLGYIVTRAKPPSPAYPVPAPYPTSQLSFTASIFRRIFDALCSPIRRFFSWLVRPSTNWWHPLVHRRWLHHNMDYPSIFKTLQFLPSGHSIPLQPRPQQPPADDRQSSYEAFYHLYKPNTPESPSLPPIQDSDRSSFEKQSARTTPMPTLAELTHMYEGLPVTPPPLPRKRDRPSGKTISAPPKHHPTDKNDARHRPPFLTRLLSYFPFYSAPVAPPESAPMRINPFMALRQGNKTIIIAVVDAGIVSFFRFGQGAFEERPMVSAPRG
ncbi:hypothetical protein BGW80DRAFT_1317147 [Lactifluus volemus]|nr:hypothetical protein BGW80DRAFT_1317147 [Lactifluus volemus]